ncbi:glycosyl hydrolase [Stenotrophobium rhamnosiphilum]|uniref:Glycoside hydrolase n=1 Tax=Stenotrophobium rhamnosiphilum TaxID=2029166 RepID=A0A2T5MKM4_9GAMM|nr:glycosyl hydrolase [Stenotrophobium rhamnosiphilum]PTU33108.1 glycoside hydrolase [Stenotrophobium rhamnosiphilum]
MATTLPCSSHAEAANPTLKSVDPLYAGFVNPPNAARPRVWWHWMNGNVTKEGIRKDFEWMQRVGIGGVHNFDASLSTPQVVDKRLIYMSPEWDEAFSYAVGLADQLGMEFGIAASPGWSETGGPWVPPQDAMKKLVWTSIDVAGGQALAQPLPTPSDVAGPFQALPPSANPAAAYRAVEKPVLPRFYSDIAVLAFPIEQTKSLPTPKISLSDGVEVASASIVDDSYDTGIEVPVGDEKKPGWVSIEYPTSQTIRSITVFVPGVTALFGSKYQASLEVEEGTGWQRVTDVPLTGVPSTASFDPVTAKRFRVLLTHVAPVIPKFAIPAEGSSISLKNFFGPLKPSALVTELRLSSESRIDRFEAKAGFAIVPDYYAIERADSSNDVGAPTASVRDVTSFLHADGTLAWTPPEGTWRILRVGYSLTGTTNHPATKEATGLEVDKYDGAAVGRYINHYFDTYRSAVGDKLIGKRGVRAVLTDSIEVKASNWTPAFIAQFKRLRGYDPIPWLPALTGTIVGDRISSEHFLYDFRRTLADLIASEHYGKVAEAAHDRGLFYYSEALENGRPSLGDDMGMRAPADIPMGAFWTHPVGTQSDPTFFADLKGAASVAHVYGKPLVAAESLTTALHPWGYGPADLLPMINRLFAAGVNRPVLHTSVHQPIDSKGPGLTLSIFGLDFNRLDSWAGLAKPWVTYISRSSYLLQQGKNIADVAYFYGEEGPLTALYHDKAVQDAPRRYAYDFVNSEIVLNELSVVKGKLVSRSGAQYRLLYLGGSSEKMTVPVLRRLKKLVADGATIVGMAPTSSPSLADDSSEFSSLVTELWRSKKYQSRVIATRDVEAALKKIQVTPDFDPINADVLSDILFVHRQSREAEIYFIHNATDVAKQFDAGFRVSGRVPEIWNAETGAVEPVSYRTEGDVTKLRMSLRPQDGVFVVFQRRATRTQLEVPQRAVKKMIDIEGPWSVAFQADRGAPTSAQLTQLSSLSENQNPAIKYFSGVATYRTSFKISSKPQGNDHVFINLGGVGDVAELKVNGKSVGYAWKSPFRIDVTSALQVGENELEISVANLWVNRLIGDAQTGATSVTGLKSLPYLPTTPLRQSGLIGPVSLEVQHCQFL